MIDVNSPFAGLRRARTVRTCRRGATAVEFALLAPVFFAMLFGLIETGRALWIRQTLADVAFATARCMSVGTVCPDASAQKTFAIARAKSFGMKLEAGDIKPVSAVCNGQVGANRVTIAVPFVSAARGLVPLPQFVTVTGCFPILA